MRVTIIGAGKVGRSLARALQTTAHSVTLRAARRGVPRQRIESALLLLAVRDGELTRWAEQLVVAVLPAVLVVLGVLVMLVLMLRGLVLTALHLAEEVTGGHGRVVVGAAADHGEPQQEGQQHRR